MPGANHFPPENALTPDEQEFGSTRYIYNPLLFIKLRSGNIAVAKGLGARDLIRIFDPLKDEDREAFFALILQYATTRTMSAAEQRLLTTTTLQDLDLSSLDLGDL